MNEEKKALIIFPTYNEKENIEIIIKDVLERDSRINVLVVDDSSPDGTGEIVDRMALEDSRINVLHRSNKKGLGRAYIAGFKWAIEHKFDYIFEMDADFSHDPKYLPDFLNAIEKYDLVLGSRYISGVNVINWPMKRLLLSYYANVYTRIVTGLPVRDGTGGFKCFRREVLEALDLDAIRSNGYIFQIEVSMRVWKKGYRIKEIPIVFADRERGTSKMSKDIVREAIWKVWYLRLMSMLGKI
ncbi:MAG: polyprenol monophosphomannose synthase [Candidatus Zixiibacteriota bacterium]|nr:MAG: polyprenol monophosphomannose synthase [candidate division Zixibacteria bacterium]HDL04117.1 polyprenol monophosphomannose synthase [candidate division Zixibacteria bacterium]